MEIRAGEFLETLGRKKSAIIITALNEYLDHHPELSDGSHPIVNISSLSVSELELKIKSMIEERIAASNMLALPPTESCQSVSADAVSKDIVEMLGDLELFNIC